MSQFIDDPQLLKELAVLFLQDCPRLMSELKTAVERRDPKAIEFHAHTLKGSLAHFDANAATGAAFQLESQGRSGDLAGVDQSMQVLETVLRPVLDGLRRLA